MDLHTVLILLATGVGGGIMAAIVGGASVITFPVLAVFLAFQRQFVASVAGTGIKG